MQTTHKTKSFYKVVFFLIGFSFWHISCAHRYHKHHKKESLATIKPVNKSQVKGWVHFQKTKKKKVLVRAEITGLSPNKQHGFHIHQYGDCRNNGQNAGSHWNPKGHPHGDPSAKKRHWGDLGNLTADSTGKALYEKEVSMCLYKTGGRSVIVHAHPDDLKTQPSGKAGPYIACGVIGYVQPKKVQKPLVKKETTKKSKPLLKKAKATKKDKPLPKEAKKATKKGKPLKQT